MNPEDVAPLIASILVPLTIGVVIILRGPLGKALARRIEGKAAVEPGLAERIEDLEHRLAAVDQDRGRVAELEERVDFAERMLAKAPGRLEGKTP